uniref:Uncharacterized protein n=1 Tax=Sphaerodactylus townsendi TaxID=933632 RepID=A0ACB8F8X3_9SAUR
MLDCQDSGAKGAPIHTKISFSILDILDPQKFTSKNNPAAEKREIIPHAGQQEKSLGRVAAEKNPSHQRNKGQAYYDADCQAEWPAAASEGLEQKEEPPGRARLATVEASVELHSPDFPASSSSDLDEPGSPPVSKRRRVRSPTGALSLSLARDGLSPTKAAWWPCLRTSSRLHQRYSVSAKALNLAPLSARLSDRDTGLKNLSPETVC